MDLHQLEVLVPLPNIVGKAWVGIVPDKEVIGLSSPNRIVPRIAERSQIPRGNDY